MPTKEERIKNLREANAKSHEVIKKSLKDALYHMIRKEDINKIKVVDLIKKAGVSRSCYYKYYYLPKDILIEDWVAIVNEIGANLGPDLVNNWRIIFSKVYEHKEKIPLLLKAGLGMEFLETMNRLLYSFEDVHYYYYMSIWNGAIFQSILSWERRGFKESVEEITEMMEKYTRPIFGIEL